jgi:hypothetical protein
MLRIHFLGFLILTSWLPRLEAANPEDLEFRVRLAEDRNAYYMGEAIPVEVVYSSQSENKYRRLSLSSLGNLEVRVWPSDGVVDRQLLQGEGGWAGSILGGEAYLGPQEMIQPLDLCALYRFSKPGQYSVRILSKEVSRIRSAQEGGGNEQLTLEAGPLNFEILAPDPAWAAGELRQIEEQLENTAVPGESARALSRLGHLDTPASVKMLLQPYLDHSEAGPEWLLVTYLRESSQMDFIIPKLERALSEPAVSVPSSLPELLATLQTRQDLGLPTPYPGDAGDRQGWSEQQSRRQEVHAKYLAAANALLVASIDRRNGPQRAAALYQAWLDAETLDRAKPSSPAKLMKLRQGVLSVVEELDRGKQEQFLISAWQTVPHSQLLPVIRNLAADPSLDSAFFPSREAFHLWCEDWPADCTAAILSAAVESHIQTDQYVLLMMTEGEHPELDTMLNEQLHAPELRNDSQQSQRTAALVLRAGSRGIAPSVDAFLDALPGCTSAVEGYLIGYLFRTAPANAGRRLSALLQERDGSCGYETLRWLSFARYSDDLIAIAIRGLDSANLQSAHASALFLGAHGPASSEDALWRRLGRLWQEWRGQLRDVPMNAGAGRREERAALEQALASALANSPNWKLNSAELERLRIGCLTAACRDIADGKLSLNF